MKTNILAIDIGTSGTKLLLLDAATGGSCSVTMPYETYRPETGWAEQDPDEWWQAVCAGIPRLLEKAGVTAEDIAAIGVDGMSWTPVLLDEAGQCLGRTPLWYDTRSQAECGEIRATVGEEAVFETSGNPIQPYYTYPKVRWFRKRYPEKAGKIRHILTSNGWIVYKLTGRQCTDYTQAYGYPFFNMEKRCWDAAMMAALGESAGLYPPLCESTAIAGVTGRDAEAYGLCAGIPVAAGGLDAACGAAGAGVIDPSALHEQSGSAGGMSICQTEYHAAKGLIMGCHVVPGEWLLQGGTVGGGSLVPWLRGTLCDPRDETPAGEQLQRLFALAEAAVPTESSPLFLPYMAGERSPIWNPSAVGVFFGLDFTTSRGDMVRAVLEGAAMALRHNIETAFPQEPPKAVLRAVGGASRNPLWMQLKADITGCPICAVQGDEATGIGCAMVAGVAAGVYASFAEAADRLVALGKTYTPDPARKALYRARFAKYLALYDHLRDMM